MNSPYCGWDKNTDNESMGTSEFNFMQFTDKQGESLRPDPNTVSPSSIPTVPAPVPIPMPTPEEEAEPVTNVKTSPKPETTKDNLQYK